MNTYSGGRFLSPGGLLSFGLLGPAWPYQEPAGSLTRRRAQTWRALFSAPCALREARGKARLGAPGWAGEIGASVSAASLRCS